MLCNMVLKFVSIIAKKTYKVLICSKRLYGTQRLSLGLLLALIVILATMKNFNFTFKRESKPMSLLLAQGLVEERLKEYYLEEKGNGCEIPNVDPFSAEAMKFNENLPEITCKGDDWVICNKSECYVKSDVLKNIPDVSCSYRDIVYVNDNDYFLSDYTALTGGAKYTLKRSDHVKIYCTGKALNSYGFLNSRWSGLKAGFRPVETQPIPSHRKDSYNVLILAFDSASHNGFMRKMPKSYKFLAEKAIILNGHNIVGDGTVAALCAILTGIPEYEHPDARKKITDQVFVNHESFLFHQLKAYGYRTAYFEDMPYVGTFQYRFNGFLQQPADHYLRALLLENEKKISYISTQNDFCFGAIPQYQLLLNLTNEFLQLDGKKFGFTFIADICHDNFNQIATADESVLWLLETLDARRVFEDTLVIVMGDHGTRFEQIRETYQGKLEERLPLMAIFLPEKLKKLRPDALAALKLNVDVLTTPFDIHTTLLDVLDLKDKSNTYKLPGCDLPRALTLLEPVPKMRTCAEAGIVQHWCSCTKWFNVSQLAPIYIRVSHVLARYINNATEELRTKCARRQLVTIMSVQQRNVNNQLLRYGYKKEEDAYLGNSINSAPRAIKEYYQAKIILSPGRGVFEGTVTYNTRTDSFAVTLKDISRISRYGTEPKCISETHPHLNPFCYCKDHITTTKLIQIE